VAARRIVFFEAYAALTPSTPLDGYYNDEVVFVFLTNNGDPYGSHPGS
jgi:hypothetical protein